MRVTLVLSGWVTYCEEQSRIDMATLVFIMYNPHLHLFRNDSNKNKLWGQHLLHPLFSLSRDSSLKRM